MTRDEFLRDSPYWNWPELLSFCSENSLSACEDIIESDSLDEYICEDIRNALTHDYWYQIRDSLSDIIEGGEYYRCEGAFEYVCVDEEVASYIDDALTEMDDMDRWDPEDGDDEDGNEYEEDDDEEDAPDNEDRELSEGVFSVSDFMAAGSAEIAVIRKTEAERIETEIKEFEAELEKDRSARIRLREEEKKREACFVSESLSALNELISMIG